VVNGNFVLLEGKLPDEPILKLSEKGNKYFEFRISNSTSKWIDNNWDLKLEKFTVQVWGNTYQCYKNLKKNIEVHLTGKLHHTDCQVFILAENIEIIASGKRIISI
jgi:hypothetical protein